MSELINDYTKSKNPSQEELSRRAEMAKNFQKYQITSAVIAGLALLGVYFKYITLNYFIALVLVAGFITLYGIRKTFFKPMIEENSKTSPGIYKRLKVIAVIGLALIGLMVVLMASGK